MADSNVTVTTALAKIEPLQALAVRINRELRELNDQHWRTITTSQVENAERVKRDEALDREKIEQALKTGICLRCQRAPFDHDSDTMFIFGADEYRNPFCATCAKEYEMELPLLIQQRNQHF